MTANTTHPPTTGATDRWENEGGQMTPLAMPSVETLQVELKRYGVVPVNLTVFDWGGYRYSNSSDAIAAAKRAFKSA